MKFQSNQQIVLPALPLRDTVIYPQIVTPLFVGRAKSIKCLEFAMEKDKEIILVTQKDASLDEPTGEDLFNTGVTASIIQLLKLPDGTVKILVKGTSRSQVKTWIQGDQHLFCRVEHLQLDLLDKREEEVLMHTVLNQFEAYIQLNKKIPSEILAVFKKIKSLSQLVDNLASQLSIKTVDKQAILENHSTKKRLEQVMILIESEISLLKTENTVRNRVKSQMEKSQKEYYLNEQMKAIQKELGEIEEMPDECEELRQKLDSSRMSNEAYEKVYQEIQKLKTMPSMSAEATVVRSYIDWILQIPWHTKSKVKKDLIKAQQVLDEGQHGLTQIKERILEYLAVQIRSKKIRGPILCLVGPPGVGKTSLGKSIAKATGRKYIRMALGGVRDEAEIRGHRRTYVGAMPGKLMQKVIKSGVKNPLLLLDEIDKISTDIRSDPTSALLEVLDTEQNHAFNDHYLEIDYNLSQVMFIATSNSMNIPLPLLDRMEIIHLPGYTEEEKLQITHDHLIKKQLVENSLSLKEAEIEKNAVIEIIRHYTKEAGVRNLERQISKIFRKIVVQLLVNKDKKKITVTTKNLEKYLGVKKFISDTSDYQPKLGHVTGLAWTEVGGELLTIETACVPGKGKLIYTGSLGKVMQESIQTALTVVRARAKLLKINENFYEKQDIHVHVPEGATPKDGPSAGIAMCTAVTSCLTGNYVRGDIGMTGEITLQGKVLPIGGLKEKLLAAHRGGIKSVIIPNANKRNLSEIPKNILSKLKIYPVNYIEDVFEIALVSK